MRVKVSGRAEGFGLLLRMLAEALTPVAGGPIPVVTHDDRPPAGDVLDARQCGRCGVWTVGACECTPSIGP